MKTAAQLVLPPHLPDQATRAEVRRQLERMLSHDALARSERLSRFLRFVVEEALEGKAAELKEYTVALNVFDKNDAFDPRTDPIVRVEAGLLRQRIEEYYRIHPADPVLIRLPTRGYRPVIRRMRPSDRKRLPARPATESATSAIGHPPTRIVVLPFRDLSDDQSQEYFCEAITEQITGNLSRFPCIRAAAHTSALLFSDAAIDVRRIGRDLGVDLVVEGSVQRSGRRIRVYARASRSNNGLQIWSETLDRELREVLALQDDVAESIVSSLHTLMSALRPVIGRPPAETRETGCQA